MKPKPASLAPRVRALAAALGPACVVWGDLLAALRAKYPPLDLVWKESKLEFGFSCRLQYKKHTLVYLAPEKPGIRVAVVLGERAAELALQTDLPAPIQRLIAEARPHAEGRGIVFHLASTDDLPAVLRLVELKTTSK